MDCRRPENLRRGLRAVAFATCLLGALVGGTPAYGEAPVPEPGSHLSRGARPGRFVLSSDGGNRTYSRGAAVLHPAIGPSFRVRVTWQRLTADDDHAIELELPGGVFLLKRGGFAFWTSDATFAGWQPLPGHTNHRATRVEVVQRGAAIEVVVDGRALGRRAWPSAPGPARLVLSFKGAVGYRSQVLFSDVAIESF